MDLEYSVQEHKSNALESPKVQSTRCGKPKAEHELLNSKTDMVFLSTDSDLYSFNQNLLILYSNCHWL